MKVVRVVLLCGLFIVGVFISSANVAPVDLVLWPNLGRPVATPARSVEVPLFVLVLASVLFGLVLGGATALFEQGRLRWGLRRAEKTTRRLKAEASSAEANLMTQREQVERLSLELAAARRELAESQATDACDGELEQAGQNSEVDEKTSDDSADHSSEVSVEVVAEADKD